MRESLQPLFLTTGAMVWVVIAGFAAICVLALVVDYSWRSLRWLFGLPRGSGLWQERTQDVEAQPDVALPHGTATVNTPETATNPFGPPDWLRREQEAAEAAHMARQSSVASVADSDATTGEQAAPDASRLQSVAWAAGEVSLAQPKPVEGA